MKNTQNLHTKIKKQTPEGDCFSKFVCHETQKDLCTFFSVTTKHPDSDSVADVFVTGLQKNSVRDCSTWLHTTSDSVKEAGWDRSIIHKDSTDDFIPMRYSKIMVYWDDYVS